MGTETRGGALGQTRPTGPTGSAVGLGSGLGSRLGWEETGAGPLGGTGPHPLVPGGILMQWCVVKFELGFKIHVPANFQARRQINGSLVVDQANRRSRANDVS